MSEVPLISVKDIAKHFQVSHGAVVFWIKKSKDSSWAHKPIPKPFKEVSTQSRTRRYWLPEQLNTDWTQWYLEFLKDKALRSWEKSEEYRNEEE